MIKFECTKCKHSYRVSDQYASKRMRCKVCGEIITIPSVKIETVSCEDSLANLNFLLHELSEYENQVATHQLEV